MRHRCNEFCLPWIDKSKKKNEVIENFKVTEKNLTHVSKKNKKKMCVHLSRRSNNKSSVGCYRWIDEACVPFNAVNVIPWCNEVSLTFLITSFLDFEKWNVSQDKNTFLSIHIFKIHSYHQGLSLSRALSLSLSKRVINYFGQ